MLSCSVMPDSLLPHELQPARLLCPRGLSRQEYLSGLPCPPLGVFPTQGSNPGLLHCRWILYCLSHQGSPRILEWVTYPFSRGISQPRNQTGVSCIAGEFFTSWDIKETQTNYMFALTFYTSLLLFFIFQVFYYAINMDLWNFLYISLEHFTD